MATSAIVSTLANFGIIHGTIPASLARDVLRQGLQASGRQQGKENRKAAGGGMRADRHQAPPQTPLAHNAPKHERWRSAGASRT